MRASRLNLSVWSVLLVLLAAAVPAFACSTAGAAPANCCLPGQQAPCSPGTSTDLGIEQTLSCCAASGGAAAAVTTTSAGKEIKKLDKLDQPAVAVMVPHPVPRRASTYSIDFHDPFVPPIGSHLYLSTLRLRL